jgi:hypothetical protein
MECPPTDICILGIKYSLVQTYQLEKADQRFIPGLSLVQGCVHDGRSAARARHDGCHRYSECRARISKARTTTLARSSEGLVSPTAYCMSVNSPRSPP